MKTYELRNDYGKTFYEGETRKMTQHQADALNKKFSVTCGLRWVAWTDERQEEDDMVCSEMASEHQAHMEGWL